MACPSEYAPVLQKVDDRALQGRLARRISPGVDPPGTSALPSNAPVNTRVPVTTARSWPTLPPSTPGGDRDNYRRPPPPTNNTPSTARTIAEPPASFHFFWDSSSVFSQWYLCDIEHDGVTYNCAEKMMMAQKAALFGDTTTEHRVKVTRNPADQQALGRQTKRLYHQMPIGAAHRELARSQRQIVLAPGYALVSRSLWLHNFSITILFSGTHIRYKARDGLWWLGKIVPPVASSGTPPEPSPGGSYIIRFLDDPGPIKIDLQPARYTTARNAVYGSWCLQHHGNGSLARGLLRNSDVSRGAPTVSTASPG